MQRTLRVGWAGLVALIVVGSPLAAAAQDKVSVEPGKQITIVEQTDLAIESQSAEKGKAEVKKADDGKRSSLIYAAPASGATSDVVKFSLGGKPQLVNVTIAKAGGDIKPGDTANSLVNADTYGPALRILFEAFVLAVVLENGLAVLFNWRPFVMTFAAAAKPVFSLAFSLLVVWHFKLDLTTDLVNILSTRSHEPSSGGYFITALLLAGGSSGVNNVLVALGFRSVKTAETVVAKPPPTKAWLAVKLQRGHAAGPVFVLLSYDKTNWIVAGSIAGTSQRWRLVRALLRDKGRFPGVGGFPLEPGKGFSVKLKGTDAQGGAIESVVTDELTPSAGAIVDITVSL